MTSRNHWTPSVHPFLIRQHAATATSSRWSSWRGTTLQTRIAGRGLSTEEASGYALQIADAVAVAHAKGMSRQAAQSRRTTFGSVEGPVHRHAAFPLEWTLRHGEFVGDT